MVELDFPRPVELHNKIFPNEKFQIHARIRENSHSLDSFIGGVPKNKTYLLISCKSGWNSNTWDRLVTAYEKKGYETHLRKSSGSTRTRSGHMKHAKTQLYVW
jgi:hypothetical protein